MCAVQTWVKMCSGAEGDCGSLMCCGGLYFVGAFEFVGSGGRKEGACLPVAPIVKWYDISFPSWGPGFDSRWAQVVVCVPYRCGVGWRELAVGRSCCWWGREIVVEGREGGASPPFPYEVVEVVAG
jgi:hypothetical protein